MGQLAKRNESTLMVHPRQRGRFRNTGVPTAAAAVSRHWQAPASILLVHRLATTDELQHLARVLLKQGRGIRFDIQTQ